MTSPAVDIVDIEGTEYEVKYAIKLCGIADAQSGGETGRPVRVKGVRDIQVQTFCSTIPIFPIYQADRRMISARVNRLSAALPSSAHAHLALVN